MTAERIYERDFYDAFSRTVRCQAEVRHRGVPTPRRCANRAPDRGPSAGLCWRHR